MKHQLNNVTKITNQKFVNLYVANYNLPNGKTLNYEIASRRKLEQLSVVTHNHNFTDAVKILPYTIINDVPHLVFIKEFRHAIGDAVFSLPAGLAEHNEENMQSAIRELKEEIGATVNYICSYVPISYMSMGLTDESMECFLANVTLNQTAELSEDEDITTELVPLNNALQFLKTHKCDLPTQLLVRTFLLERSTLGAHFAWKWNKWTNKKQNAKKCLL